MNSIEDEKLCVICNKTANATGSHIVPVNLIKNCVGKRDYEESFEIDLLNRTTNMFLGMSNPKSFPENKSELRNIALSERHHYVVDYILCIDCEKKLGKIEGTIYDEIICKMRETKFKNNFKTIIIDGFEVITPISKKISIEDLNIYFYSIVLRVYYYLRMNSCELNIESKTINLISNMINNLMNKNNVQFSELNTSLIVYITNNPNMFPTLLETNIFDKLIIPVCNFFIILEKDNTFITPFGNCQNNLFDKEFKFIKNSKELDEKLFSIKNLMLL